MRVFIDTSAFYALEDADDRHHKEAKEIQNWCSKNRPAMFTTHHVLDECITLIGARLNPEHALRFGRRLLSSRIVCIIRTDEEMEAAALNVYEKFRNLRLSFTDSLSFTVMRSMGIPASFTFDSHFEQAGFAIIRSGSF